MNNSGFTALILFVGILIMLYGYLYHVEQAVWVSVGVYTVFMLDFLYQRKKLISEVLQMLFLMFIVFIKSFFVFIFNIGEDAERKFNALYFKIQIKRRAFQDRYL